MPVGHAVNEGDLIAFTLSYTPPAGTTLAAGGNITINANGANNLLPSATGGVLPTRPSQQIQAVQPLALATGGVASVPATGALALGAMAALVALTPAALGRRRKKAGQR